MARTIALEDAILHSLAQSLDTSTRRLVTPHHMSQKFVWKAVHDKLLYTFHLHIVQELNPALTFKHCRTFCSSITKPQIQNSSTEFWQWMKQHLPEISVSLSATNTFGQTQIQMPSWRSIHNIISPSTFGREWEKPPNSPDRDSNLKLPFLGSQTPHETNTLANYATEAASAGESESGEEESSESESVSDIEGKTKNESGEHQRLVNHS
uniref:Uncharacterized protein n=1 Tax=Timema cristinae TaxID=61476 RepID=A0A7R9CQG7_TIMCR|nr:unnamed protein product [Timema cristinae]